MTSETNPPPGDQDEDAALNAALDDLERVLSDRRQSAEEESQPRIGPTAGPDTSNNLPDGERATGTAQDQDDIPWSRSIPDEPDLFASPDLLASPDLSASKASGEPNETGDEDAELPLLDDVVVPGSAEATTGADDYRTSRMIENILPTMGASAPRVDDRSLAEIQARVVERIASELEIIIDTRMEAAMARLTAETRRAVREHLDIVLPEILADVAGVVRPPRD